MENWDFVKYCFLIGVGCSSCVDKKGAEDQNSAFQATYTSARTEWELGNLDQSVAILEELIIDARNVDNFEYEARALYLQAFVVAARDGVDEQILQLYVKSKNAYSKSKNYEGYATVCSGISVFLLDHNKVYGAEHFMKESLKYAKLSKVEMIISTSQLNYGLWLNRLGQYDSSLYYFHQSYIYEKSAGNLANVCNIYISEGYIYSELKKYDVAEQKYLLALPIVIENNWGEMIGKCYNNIGFCKLQTGEDSLALAYFELALKHYTNDKDKTVVYNNIGKTYLKKGQMLKAAEALRLSLKHQKSGETRNVDELIGSFRALQNYHREQGHTDSVNYYADLQSTLTKTLMLYKRNIDEDRMNEHIDAILKADREMN